MRGPLRLPGLSRALREGLAAIAPAAGAVTTLGDPDLLLVLLAVLYWAYDRETGARVAGAAVLALVAVLLLKHLFALPRPPVSVRPGDYRPGSFGFPSGHATAATVVYGGLALVDDRTDTGHLLAVGAIVAAVALSRVVIGVHYLGDVLAGVVLGVVVLAVTERVLGGRPVRSFGAATVLAVPALAVVGPTGDALLALGGGLGGLLGTARLDAVPPVETTAGRGVLVVAGVGFVVGMRLLTTVVAGVAPALVVVNGLLVAGIFLAPAGVDRLPLGSPAGPD